MLACRLGARGPARVALLLLLSACTPTPPPLDASIDDASTDGSLPLDVATDAPPRDLGRVLFVGNSYTTYNDLPGTVRAVVAASGGTIEVEAITMDGAFLSAHLPPLRARLLAEPPIDRVVLQGQSLEAAGVIESAFDLAAAMASESLGETPAVWYATWARRAGDPIYATAFEGPDEMAAVIDRAYQMAANVNDDATARVGIAWQLARAELPEVELYLSDGSHPTPAGTLLAACVIAEVMLGTPPRAPSPPPAGLTAEQADALCALAPRARVADTLGLCGGEWIDPNTDPAHCGGCGMACSADDPCFGGVCGCPFGTACDRRCVFFDSDEQNCGACGAPCMSGARCVSSTCACPAGRLYRTDELTGWDAASCPSESYGSEACGLAAHQACEALDCFATGVPPASGHSGITSGWIDTVVCAREADVVSVVLAACAGAASAACVTAIHRACVADGAVSGLGPVAREGEAVSIACLPSTEATLLHLTAAELGMHASRCTPEPITCSVAAMSYCQTAGYAGGYGPVEIDGEMLDVVCVGAPG